MFSRGAPDYFGLMILKIAEGKTFDKPKNSASKLSNGYTNSFSEDKINVDPAGLNKQNDPKTKSCKIKQKPESRKR